MASEIAEDRDPAKAPKSNVKDFKGERRMPSPNETQVLATDSNLNLGGERGSSAANETQPETAINN